MKFLKDAPRYLFFTGKGGVGKTSLACSTAIALADGGESVLLVSTDPASNLDEVLGAPLGAEPTSVAGVAGLSALNIDPVVAAAAYRERMVGPYRGVLPEAALRSIEEQLSGACTVEIAAFDEFSKLLGDEKATSNFDRIVFDTAPTGHTLRLLQLPAAWTGFLEENVGGTSCLGPLAGLKEQQALYEGSRARLIDASKTRLVLVARAQTPTLKEAERTRRELCELGVENLQLVVNGIFTARGGGDAIATQMQERGESALGKMPSGLAALPRTELPLLPYGLVGLAALRSLLSGNSSDLRAEKQEAAAPSEGEKEIGSDLGALLTEICESGTGVVLTMGKGGVGKTSVAAEIARELARRGHPVHLTTTDPAAHIEAALGGEREGIRLSRIDPEAETRAYSEGVLANAGKDLDEAGRALLEEDLRSPCTEEIAVFQAFARLVDEGEKGFVVIDTAPTGHTLLLLDAAESYHKEVLRTSGEAPDAVRRLLPRLRDPKYSRIFLVTLAEATPVHEAAQLQKDLARAGIRPFAWVVNQSLLPLKLTDPVLVRRRDNEARYLKEVKSLATRVALLPWS